MRFFPYFLVSTLILSGVSIPKANASDVDSMYSPPSSDECKNLEIIFARGTNEKLNDASVNALRKSIADAFDNSKITYNIYDLGSEPHNGFQYPASNVDHFIGTYLSAGTAYQLGASIDQGIGELKAYFSEISTKCLSTKFALVGYSQGAAVISRTLDSLDSHKIVYVANISDPKLYLPEGEGLFPSACRNENLSEYRVLVEDCRVSAGILGAKKPYTSTVYHGKVGTWCNKNDFICGSSINWLDPLGAHITYRELGRYNDVANHILKKSSQIITPSKPTSSKPNSNQPSKPESVIVLFDYASYSSSSVNALVSKLTNLKLDSNTPLNLYLYNNTSSNKEILNPDYINLNPYFSSRAQYLKVSSNNHDLTYTAHEIYKNDQDANYGSNPRVILVKNNSVKELSNEDFMRIVNAFIFNNTPSNTPTDPSWENVEITYVKTDAPTHNNQPKTLSMSNNPNNNQPKIFLATGRINGITVSNVETAGSILKFNLKLPENSTGALFFLNDYLIGITSREELSKNDYLITISDFNPDIENNLTIKSVNENGYPTETFEIAPNFVNSQLSKPQFPPVKTPDCGIVKTN